MIKKLALTVVFSLLIIISFTLILYSRVTSENDILNKMEEMNYYDYAYENIMSKLELELPNNELSFVYNKYVTKDRIKSDIKSILDNYYNNEHNGIKKEFHDAVLKEFSKHDENIESLVNNLTNTYYNNLFRIDKLNTAIKKTPLKNASKALAFVTLAATIFLAILFIKNIALYNSFIISGIVFLIPKLFILFKDIIKDFYYYNDTLSYFFKMYGYSIINTYFKCGLIFIVIGLVGFGIKTFTKDNWLKILTDI